MANITEKTCGNVYYQARCRAAEHNEMLCSREGAAEIMAIERGRLYRVEKGIANPHPEEVHLMADCYGAPELRPHFCKEMCPLGRDNPNVTVQDLDRIALKLLSILSRTDVVKDTLLAITADGIIDETEQEDMLMVIDRLDEVVEQAQTLKLWVKKNMKQRR